MAVAQPNTSLVPKPFMGIKMGPICIYYATWFSNIVQLVPRQKVLSGLLTSAGNAIYMELPLLPPTH